MYGVIQEIGFTAKGTTKLKLNGNWVYAGRLDVSSLREGQGIEYFVSPFKAGDKTLQGLESFKPAPASAGGLAGHTPPIGSGSIAAPSTVQRSPDGLSEPELRFVSNVVGSAIASGACKAPADIGQWFRSSYLAVKAKYFEDDSDIP